MRKSFVAIDFAAGSSRALPPEARQLVHRTLSEGGSANEGGPESQVLALSAEYASVPIRSPATSIILAETVRRSPEASVSRKRPWTVFLLIQNLLKLADFAGVGVSGKVSVVFTQCGPLVYQWKGIYCGPEVK